MERTVPESRPSANCSPLQSKRARGDIISAAKGTQSRLLHKIPQQQSSKQRTERLPLRQMLNYDLRQIRQQVKSHNKRGGSNLKVREDNIRREEGYGGTGARVQVKKIFGF